MPEGEEEFAAHGETGLREFEGAAIVRRYLERKPVPMVVDEGVMGDAKLVEVIDARGAFGASLRLADHRQDEQRQDSNDEHDEEQLQECGAADAGAKEERLHVA